MCWFWKAWQRRRRRRRMEARIRRKHKNKPQKRSEESIVYHLDTADQIRDCQVQVPKFLEQSVTGSLSKKKYNAVFETVDQDGLRSVTRVVRRDTDLEYEIFEALRGVDSPYLMKYRDYKEIDGYRLYQYEFLDGQPLRTYLDRHEFQGRLLDELTVHRIFNQVVRGVRDLHRVGIVHCDLKLDNILVDRQLRVKIIDFDLSRVIGDTVITSRDLFGTAKYMAPESVHIQVYSKAVDLWALGVILYRMVVGEFPFNLNLNLHDISKNLMRGNGLRHPKIEWLRETVDRRGFHVEIIGLVQRLLSFRDIDRGTVDELIDQPWLRLEKSQLIGSDEANKNRLVID